MTEFAAAEWERAQAAIKSVGRIDTVHLGRMLLHEVPPAEMRRKEGHGRSFRYWGRSGRLSNLGL